jgi:hypothetical protein
LLPFVHERRRELAEKSAENARAFMDCRSCLRNVPKEARQLWNCGHLPRLPLNQYAGPALECRIEPDAVCPGYSISLPQVIETSHAHAWWEKGQLRDFCEGEQPTELIRACVGILAGSLAESIDRAAAKKRRPDG